MANLKKAYVWLFIIAIVALVVAVSLHDSINNGEMKSQSSGSSTTTPSNAVSYFCSDGKGIKAIFFENPQSYVVLALSDGRALNLPQAVSGSGIRYELPDAPVQAGRSPATASSTEDIVFWSEGNNAFLTENGATTYGNCV